MVDEIEVQPEVAEVKEVMREPKAPEAAAVHPAVSVLEEIELRLKSIEDGFLNFSEHQRVWFKAKLAQAKAHF